MITVQNYAIIKFILTSKLTSTRRDRLDLQNLNKTENIIK